MKAEFKSTSVFWYQSMILFGGGIYLRKAQSVLGTRRRECYSKLVEYTRTSLRL